MIGKIIGAMAGARVAKHTQGLNEPGGAMLGAAALALGRRLGRSGGWPPRPAPMH